MKLSVIVTILVLLVGGVGALYAYNRLQPEPVPAVEARQVDTQLTITVTGEVQADETVSISPPVSGRIAALYVGAGDGFTAGAPLAELDLLESNQDVAEAQGRVIEAQGAYTFQTQGTRPETIARLKAAVESAQANVVQAQANVAKAQAEAQFASAEAQRYAGLVQKSFVSTQDVQSKATAEASAQAALKHAQAAYQTARNQKAQAVSEWEQARNGPTQAERTQALGGLRAAQGAKASAMVRQQDRILRAPFSGRVVERLQRVGDLAQPGKAVLKVINPSTLEVVAHVEEVDLGQVKKGAEVNVILDALPDVLLPGRVYKVGHAVNPEKGTVDARVKLLPEAWQKLGSVSLLSGMTADVNIGTVRLKQAILVPTSAVVQGQKGPQVYLFENHHLKPTLVKLQRVSADYYAILRGLAPGQWVAEIAQPELLKRDRVTPRPIKTSAETP